MFEQTFLTQADSARRPWSLAASLAVQCAFTGAILLVPLLQTAQLALRPAPVILYIPPRRIPPAQVVVQQVASHSSAASLARPQFRPVFTAPSAIPKTISILPDPAGAPEFLLASNAGTGQSLSFGPPSLGLENGPAARTAPQAAQKTTTKPAAIRVSNGVQSAKLLSQPKPLYPAIARAARVSGQVRLQAVIARDGTIRNLQLVGGHPLLVRAAFNAVSRWTYQPTLLNGEPVEVLTEIEVNFTLNQ